MLVVAVAVVIVAVVAVVVLVVLVVAVVVVGVVVVVGSWVFLPLGRLFGVSEDPFGCFGLLVGSFGVPRGLLGRPWAPRAISGIFQEIPGGLLAPFCIHFLRFSSAVGTTTGF